MCTLCIGTEWYRSQCVLCVLVLNDTIDSVYLVYVLVLNGTVASVYFVYSY